MVPHCEVSERVGHDRTSIDLKSKLRWCRTTKARRRLADSVPGDPQEVARKSISLIVVMSRTCNWDKPIP